MLKTPRTTPIPAASAIAIGEPLLVTGTVCFAGSVTDPNEPDVAHLIRITVDNHLRITGISHWPAHPSRGLLVRSFALRGKSAANGRCEFHDDTPERFPGFRRGIYVGNLNPAEGRISGQYYEINEQTHELFYWGDWTATRWPADSHAPATG